MAGVSLDRIRKDMQKYVTKGTGVDDITLTTPDGSTTLELTGFNTKHWINFNSDGVAVNSKNAHVCLDEQTLLTAGYPVRNSNGEVYLLNHRLATKDSSGVLKEYVITEWFPSETFGQIACILGDYGTN